MNFDLQFDNSLVRGYSLSRSGQVMAILGYNSSLYFLNLKSRMLTGSRFFNRRQVNARGVKFNPVMNNLVVIYGPKGLVVWNLLDLRHFFTEPFKNDTYDGRYYKLLIDNEHQDYLSVDFSESGRYMICLVTK